MLYRKITNYKYQTTHHTSAGIPLNLFVNLPNTATLETAGGYVKLDYATRTMQIKKGKSVV